MTGDGRRAKRVGEALSRHLAEALSREVSDPRLSALVISNAGGDPERSIA